MPKPSYHSALIVGAGQGLSASLARLFAGEGMRVALAARDAGKLAPLCAEIDAKAFACDAVDPAQVAQMFSAVDSAIGPPEVVVYNASARARGPVAELVPGEVERAIMVSAFGGFLVAREAVARMMPKGHGAVLFTGASASVKGYPLSAPFAMGKFALRGLAQSMARELSPQGIHIAHFVIDGAIRNPGRVEPADKPDSMLDPDAIAANLSWCAEPAAFGMGLGGRAETVGGALLRTRQGASIAVSGRAASRPAESTVSTLIAARSGSTSTRTATPRGAHRLWVGGARKQDDHSLSARCGDVRRAGVVTYRQRGGAGQPSELGQVGLADQIDSLWADRPNRASERFFPGSADDHRQISDTQQAGGEFAVICRGPAFC